MYLLRMRKRSHFVCNYVWVMMYGEVVGQSLSLTLGRA